LYLLDLHVLMFRRQEQSRYELAVHFVHCVSPVTSVFSKLCTSYCVIPGSEQSYLISSSHVLSGLTLGQFLSHYIQKDIYPPSPGLRISFFIYAAQVNKPNTHFIKLKTIAVQLIPQNNLHY